MRIVFHFIYLTDFVSSSTSKIPFAPFNLFKNTFFGDCFKACIICWVVRILHCALWTGLAGWSQRLDRLGLLRSSWDFFSASGVNLTWFLIIPLRLHGELFRLRLIITVLFLVWCCSTFFVPIWSLLSFPEQPRISCKRKKNGFYGTFLVYVLKILHIQ